MPSCCIDEVAGPSVSAPLRKPSALAPSVQGGGGDGMADTAMMRGGMTEAQMKGFRPAMPIGPPAPSNSAPESRAHNPQKAPAGLQDEERKT